MTARFLTWFRNLLEQWRAYNTVIDPNSKCPACGARDGKLKCVFVQKGNATDVQVERTCNVCSAKCYEPTVVKPEKWVAKELLVQQTQRQPS